MKKYQMLPALLIVILLSLPFVAAAEQLPEMIGEKMAIKFARGVTNSVTCIAELPKQTILTIRDMGPLGIAIGPLKGIGMTVYRGFIGMTEAIFFLVPQPGYYDPTIEPAYVWEGWGPRRDSSAALKEDKK